jgi:uncharacterized protein YndB with AHSA1/START domain
VTSKVSISLRVPADPMRAFEAFTREISSWWRPHHLFQITERGDGELAFEAGFSGRLGTHIDTRDTLEIGRIPVWEPGKRLVFGWRHATFSPEQSTEGSALRTGR